MSKEDATVPLAAIVTIVEKSRDDAIFVSDLMEELIIEYASSGTFAIGALRYLQSRVDQHAARHDILLERITGDVIPF